MPHGVSHCGHHEVVSILRAISPCLERPPNTHPLSTQHNGRLPSEAVGRCQIGCQYCHTVGISTVPTH
jgi:hypothetical protein